MADIGALRSLAAGIPDATTRRIVTEICEEICGKGGLTFGDPDHQRRATNHRSFFEVSTTATSTGEFSIRHGLPTAPTLAIPVLDVGQPGAQLVPLEVTRAADGQRVYLKSATTSARITLLLE
jgi:hypothetical protein